MPYEVLSEVNILKRKKVCDGYYMLHQGAVMCML